MAPGTDEAVTGLAPRLRTHLTRVVRTGNRTPHLRRITFAGGDLETFAPLDAPDQFLYLLLPPPGRRELTIDASFTWEAFYTMGDDVRPVGAYYTVRHHRPARAEIDIDVVLHAEGAGGAGPASRWAASAAPGDPVALWGPRSTFTPPAAGVDWYLLVADETGLPATAAILDRLPPGVEVRVVAEVADAGERQPLAGRPGVEVRWLHRDGAPAGTTTALADAVRALDRPPGRPYVWGGGESRAMSAVRRFVRHEVGVERARVSLTPYWRHAAHAGDPDEEDG
jgi:NADPH-dependent ferric siderophore reductase